MNKPGLMLLNVLVLSLGACSSFGRDPFTGEVCIFADEPGKVICPDSGIIHSQSDIASSHIVLSIEDLLDLTVGPESK